MKKYYKFLIVLLVFSFIIPQIALGAWWNPFSWNIWNNIFHRADTKTQVLENRVKELENKLSEKPASIPTTVEETKPQKEEVVVPPKKVSTPPSSISTPQTQVPTQPILDVCKNIEGIQTAVPVGMAVSNGNCTTPVYDVCSNIEGVQTSIPAGMTANNSNCLPISNAPAPTPIPAPAPQTPTTPVGKNYYYDSISRINSILAINKSFKNWLQDTSNQFRTAVNTLAGIPGGGLYGDLRDSSINFANANITVISGMLTNTEQWISYWEGLLNAFNSHPNDFISQSAFDALQAKQSPTTLENELSTIKTKINADLSKVLSS